jgi:haloalkane dehalogenase
MQTLRTPDEQFVDLPGYSFAANYVEISDQDGGTLRVHYLDEGPADAAPVLCMHGEPSWSYLYRKMIPLLSAAGHRVIAPDLVGFGKSDKPTEKSDYTYERHVAWMQEAIIDHLDLRNATFFGQDWGGLVGLRLVAENPDRFDRAVIGNTGLPTGEGEPSEAFMAWQKFSQTTPVFDIGFLLNSATVTELTAGEIAAYDAPFPDDNYKEGARIFPTLVPTQPDDPAAEANKAAWEMFKQLALSEGG